MAISLGIYPIFRQTQISVNLLCFIAPKIWRLLRKSLGTSPPPRAPGHHLNPITNAGASAVALNVTDGPGILELRNHRGNSCTTMRFFEAPMVLSIGGFKNWTASSLALWVPKIAVALWVVEFPIFLGPATHGLLTGYPPGVPGPNGRTAESSVDTIWVRKIGQNDDTPELRLSHVQTSPYVYAICVFHMG